MKTAFLGVGNMASAVIFANGGKNIAFSDVILYDLNCEKCKRFTDEGAILAHSVKKAVEMAECVFLAVKPQDYFSLLDEVKTADGYENKLYISIGAGIKVETVEKYLGCENVVRALPNTPMLIGEGVSAICKNDKISAENFAFARSLFENAGSVIVIDESEMNRIIGVTSSSPAYVFKFISAIVEGAKAQGLCGDELLNVVCDVVSGSASLLKQSGKSCDEMIAMVASKGGTTERAIAALDENGFCSSVEKAMIDCTKRADELGKTK